MILSILSMRIPKMKMKHNSQSQMNLQVHKWKRGLLGKVFYQLEYQISMIYIKFCSLF